jgi:transposase-like protein
LWSPICSPTYGAGAWTQPVRSWSVSTAAKHCTPPSRLVFDHPVVQRCHAHKCRNVANKLPDDLAKTVTKKMRAAYQAPSAIIAEAQLQALAGELEHTHPGAAGSLHEGVSETLTVLRLGVCHPPWPTHNAAPTASSR